MKFIYTALFIALPFMVFAQDERPKETLTDSDGTEITVPARNNSEARQSPSARVDQTVGTTRIHIRYGRPFVKDREIFGNLVKYDKVWRLGANEATTISFFDDIKIGDQTVEAGTYALFAKPSEDSWDIILNSEAAQWGAYERDPAKDVATVTVEPKATDHTEMFTILFNNVTTETAHLVMRWAQTEVAVPIEIAK